MFDLRYHIASLAAVFIALAVGIVIGAAITSGGSLERTTEGIREAELAAVEDQLREAEQRADSLEGRQETVRRLLAEAYDPIMDGRLAGRRIAVIYLGADDAGLNDDIAKTLRDAGDGRLVPASVIALELPLDVEGVAARLADAESPFPVDGEISFGALGEALGLELVRGGDLPLWTSLATALAAQHTGSAAEPLDGVVVVRTWRPEETEDPETSDAADGTEAFLAGVLRGLAQSETIVVGVERESVAPEESSIGLYKRAGISTVTGVEEAPGRIALGLLLAGAEPGSYGLAEERIAPPLDSAPLPVAVA